MGNQTKKNYETHQHARPPRPRGSGHQLRSADSGRHRGDRPSRPEVRRSQLRFAGHRPALAEFLFGGDRQQCSRHPLSRYQRRLQLRLDQWQCPRTQQYRRGHGHRLHDRRRREAVCRSRLGLPVGQRLRLQRRLRPLGRRRRRGDPDPLGHDHAQHRLR